ncbi:30S ribosomal protein S27e [Candidatus Pacearchaeota archaeon]|nr:MAG: 30S ribosomal protein S27e [Candidatus Pacearchaeota archaeon]RLJ02012.1 MAG: 30S ribosomal protein S27e [Candidatus Aenigmarchaeota archaeon]
MVRSKFLKVRCECGNEQIIFNKATLKVKCLKCNKLIAEPTGGKAKILAEVIESYE